MSHLKTEPKTSPNNEEKPKTSALNTHTKQRREGRERSTERPANLGSTTQKPPPETPKEYGGSSFYALKTS